MTADNNRDNDSALDKIAERAHEIFGDDDKEDKEDKKNEKVDLDTPYQDTPDSGFGDVPQKDKIIKDPDTGEKTFIKNDNKR